MIQQPRAGKGIHEGHHFVSNGSIYIVGAINDEFTEQVVAPFHHETERRLEQVRAGEKPSPIKVYINSGGGHVCHGFDLLAAFEIAEKAGIEVHTYVMSQASSTASMIAISGTKRFASGRSQFMLHFPSWQPIVSNPETAIRLKDQYDFLVGCYVDVHTKRTKIKGLEKKLLADNFVLMGQDLLKYGLVDELI
jgi:ATP-dependent protease ClpP protease subunit